MVPWIIATLTLGLILLPTFGNTSPARTEQNEQGCIGARQQDPWPPATDVAAVCNKLIDQADAARKPRPAALREALKSRSWAYRRLGHQQAAILDATRAIALAGDDAEAFYYRSEALDKLQQYPQAIRDVRYALALDPDYARAHALYGQILLHIADYPAALKALERAKTLDFSLAGPHYHQARIHAITGHHQRAINGFNQLLKLRPDHVWARRERARAQD